MKRKATRLIAVNIYLTPKQHDMVRREAVRRRTSMSKVVRALLDAERKEASGE